MLMLTYLGSIGTGLILIAFVMNQFNKWQHDSLQYDIFNFVGGFTLIVYSVILRAYPFIILNLVWTVVSGREIIIDIKKAEKKKSHIGHKRK
jgi:hypothetical protein